MRNLQEQIKKAFCYQILFSTFTVRTFFFLTVGQSNFGNEIQFFPKKYNKPTKVAYIG